LDRRIFDGLPKQKCRRALAPMGRYLSELARSSPMRRVTQKCDGPTHRRRMFRRIFATAAAQGSQG